MKSIREMDEADRMLLASSNYDKDEMEQRQQRKMKHKMNNM